MSKAPRETIELSVLAAQLRDVEQIAALIGLPVRKLLNIGMAQGLSWIQNDYLKAVQREQLSQPKERRRDG